MKRKMSNPKTKSNTKSRSFRGKANDWKSNKNVDPQNSSKFPVETLKDKNYNDVSWYAKNQQILNDAASFSYFKPVGSKMHPLNIYGVQDADSMRENAAYTLSANDATYAVPGVMNLITGLTPGLSTSYTSPINLAAQNTYSYVRYMNSGAANYDTPDLMMYLMAMDSAYACFNHGKKAYGLINSYNQQNWYEPDAILMGMGFDPVDLRANIADLRLFLNTTAARLQSFCVPGNMSIMVRHSWMFSNVWADSSNPKAQLYQFVPYYFFEYNETGSPNGGYLQAVEWSPWGSKTPFPTHVRPTLKSFIDYKAYMTNLIDALQKSEDIGIMSGDILKAYGQEKLFKLTSVDENYTVGPVYNEEVLNQIHNATVLHEVYHDYIKTGAFNITQDPNVGYLLWNPVLNNQAWNSKYGTILNMPWENVTPANTMVGSRLACDYSVSLNANNTRQMTFSSVGTEFIHTAVICFRDWINNTAGASNPQDLYNWYAFKTINEYVAQYNTNIIHQGGMDAVQYASTIINGMLQFKLEDDVTSALLSNFDWHPLVLKFQTSYDLTAAISGHAQFNGIFTYTPFYGDMNNWTEIDATDLENLHLAAILSEFDVPVIGSF